MRPAFNQDRRGFLRQCCTAAGALWIPARPEFSGNGSPGAGFPGSEFHFHPVYRERTSFDAAVARIQPGPDSFQSEIQHERLAPILAAWRQDLLSSPGQWTRVAAALDDGFRGASWHPVERHHLRDVPFVERLRFSAQAALTGSEFVKEWHTSLDSFSKLLTVGFQITRVDVRSGNPTVTVRYELVGTGRDFYREQRVGCWQLAWKGERVVSWHLEQETRARATEPYFIDVTRAVFGGNSSYAAQLCQGADDWRTRLDGASGIDIYGHNGVSVGDIDGDGFDDLYVCQAAGLPNRLFRNRRDGTFEDVTDASGVGLLDNTACALFADFLNRGRQDLLVVCTSGPQLFLNDGQGRFHVKPDAFRFENAPQGTFTGAAAADYDRDGLLDVYFCLYSFYQGADQYNYPTPYFAAENGPPNFLMLNQGDGRFKDVTAQSGLNSNNTRYSFCCGWNDFAGNGWPDLYVVNDFGRKNLYRNNGNGTFTDVAPEYGVEDVGAGMSVCWRDFNNDGAADLYVADMWTAAGERVSRDAEFQKSASPPVREFYRKHAMGNSLFVNHGSSFEDETAHSATGIGRWAWSSDAWDFDHDGFADIYVANGMLSGPIREDLNSFFWREVVARSPNAFQFDGEYEQGWKQVNELIRSDYSWSGRERNVLFARDGDGAFADVAAAVGLDFLEDGRAFALADFDQDGRQELVVKNRDAPQLRFIKNEIPGLAPAIAFRLQGTTSNRDAVGARVTIRTSAGQQTQFVQAGSGFLSQHSKEVFFGLGRAEGAIEAAVRWPSGAEQTFSKLAANQRVWLTEGLATYRAEAFRKATVMEASVRAPDMSIGTVETWLLVPIAAPAIAAGKAMLLCFHDAATALPSDAIYRSLRVDDPNNAELAAVYNLLFRSLFDRHRDMPMPTSFLVNEQREIVKIYQGAVSIEKVRRDLRDLPRTAEERLTRALPFPGVAASYAFGRNYLSLGSTFFQHGYAEYSADFFQAALLQDAASAEALYGLGSAYLKQGKDDLARANFLKAVKEKAGYPETLPNAWNNLGLLAMREGNASEGVTCFEEAVRADANHFISLENLGNAYKQQKRWTEARVTLERALKLKPRDAEANYSLGMVFAQLDDAATAFDYLTRALQARPDYPEALNNLGILYLRTHRRNEAVATFERCMAAAPQFEPAYLSLARVYAIEGSREKARAVLQALLKARPESEAAQRALAQLP